MTALQGVSDIAGQFPERVMVHTGVLQEEIDFHVNAGHGIEAPALLFYFTFASRRAKIDR